MDRALLKGFVREVHMIDADNIRACIEELGGEIVTALTDEAK